MSWLPPDQDPTGWDAWDESAVRIRANRRGSKPRTKHRPSHAEAVAGFVVGVDRGRYRVITGSATANAPEARMAITATAARELGRGAIVTGDHVDLVGDTSGAEGSLARIVRVHDRRTLLRRSADDTDEVERIIVANANRLLIVVAAADPQPRPRLVDRYLVAAYDVGIEPILCITKTDLADPAELQSYFAGLDLRILTSTRDEPPLAALRELADGHIMVAVGHSGVGKSTLVNALVPEAQRAIGQVNAVTGRGRHTSSSTVAYQLGSGWIIDTPGVRSFGLGHVDPDHLLAAFGDLADLGADCPRGCTHLTAAPDCAIEEAIADGALGPTGRARFDSLQRLLGTLTKGAN